MELLRLTNLKASSTITNQTAKLVICIDCASILCGIEINHREAVKFSGAKTESEYNRQKELIQKLLNLNKSLTLDEICAQLEISERSKSDARQLFNAYTANQFGDADNVAHMAMAIHQSLKLRKEKNAAAKKLAQLGHLKPKQWKELENNWDNWIEKSKPLTAAAAAVDHRKTRNNEAKSKWICKLFSRFLRFFFFKHLLLSLFSRRCC